MKIIPVKITGCLELPIPPKIASQIKQELTFLNPTWAEANSFGRPTRGIDKYLYNYKIKDSIYCLPRGYFNRLCYLVYKAGYEIELFDQTKLFPPTYPPKKIELRPYQNEWITNLLSVNQGIGHAAAGAGKTICALEAYARLGQPCLWITHTQKLLEQTAERARTFLGVEPGIIADGKIAVGHLTIGLVQTLIKQPEDFLANEFGLIIGDECHHFSAKTFSEVSSRFSAHYRYGLTATPQRADGLEIMMFQLFGETLATIDRDFLRRQGFLIRPKIIRRQTRFTYPRYNPSSYQYNYKKLEKALEKNEARNRLIVSDILREAATPTNMCIALVSKIDHGEILNEMLETTLQSKVGVIHSKMPKKKVNEVFTRLYQGNLKVLIATYKMLAEGFDYQPANRLFLTAPVVDPTLIEQACGRVERCSPGKTEAKIFDYIDPETPVLRRQAEDRREIYIRLDNEVVYK